MTNKEKYQKAFSVLQLPESSSWEVEKMARLQKKAKMKTAAAIITGCLLVGGAGTAYAANVGGIQRTIQLWIHGDQTTATLEFSGDGTLYNGNIGWRWKFHFPGRRRYCD